MEKNKNNLNSTPDHIECQENLNANSSYSGSGAMQPGGDAGQPGKLSDYPDGDLNEVKRQTESIPGNQTDRPSVDETDHDSGDSSERPK